MSASLRSSVATVPSLTNVYKQPGLLQLDKLVSALSIWLSCDYRRGYRHQKDVENSENWCAPNFAEVRLACSSLNHRSDPSSSSAYRYFNVRLTAVHPCLLSNICLDLVYVFAFRYGHRWQRCCDLWHDAAHCSRSALPRMAAAAFMVEGHHMHVCTHLSARYRADLIATFYNTWAACLSCSKCHGPGQYCCYY